MGDRKAKQKPPVNFRFSPNSEVFNSYDEGQLYLKYTRFQNKSGITLYQLLCNLCFPEDKLFLFSSIIRGGSFQGRGLSRGLSIYSKSLVS